MKNLFHIILFFLFPLTLFPSISKESLIKNFDKKEKVFESTVKYLKIETFTKFDYGEILFYESLIENFIDSIKINSIVYDSSFKDTSSFSYKIKKNSPIVSQIFPEEKNLIIYPENIFKGTNLKYLLPDSFKVEDDGKTITLINIKRNEPLIYVKFDKRELSLKELSLKNIYDQIIFRVVTKRYLKNGIILPDSYEMIGVNTKTLSYSKIKNLTVQYR
ncbi:MAG: hypothetical protein QME48_03560 [bacterium]|uniref:Uncharacterized protein n=2 Tax=Bacteria candidate phyla TaxID=1783234 RepID=A0A117M6T7_UNCT6|nr:MAG: hypothetical protein XD76_1216 [candidate division TA06 bacterium 32_111]KUK87551.1 MAG: hypothetical protein XE03_0718 [candidate division TA06 bacterium 34_109]MDI6700289.1 hypothetical protein [bacterium]HAF08114.1 hypothetical protein [candidate division WOR-3 bacterium]HCP16676.1 hypothetical protein [candidate division WOR-3 bacterium]